MHLEALLFTILALSAPLILAALGGLTSERSGIMNIALEGKMLTAACVTALVGPVAHSPIAGAAAGIVAAILMSLLHFLLTQSYRIDHIVSGMAINALAIGGMRYLAKQYPSDGEIPQLPAEIYYVLAYGLPIVVWLAVRHSRAGLRLWAVGNDPDKSRAMGVDPLCVRFWALVATGIFCGLAGAMLVSGSGRFVDQMTAGKGFIALAALILGGWRPLPVFLSCVVFGTFDALQLRFQGTPIFGLSLPSEYWNMLPYVVTLIAIAGFSGRTRAPTGLGKA